MTRLILARHGETPYNKQGIIQGELDTDLNETGIEQARQLSERLRDEDITAVYASTLQRAKKTAEIIAGPHKLEVESIADLRERSFGELEGMPADERAEKIDEEGISWKEWTPEGGEHPEDVAERTVPVVESIRKQHPDETVVAVAHGQVNRSILATLVGADAGHGHVIKQDNACINELAYEDYRGWRIHRVNDTSHL